MKNKNILIVIAIITICIIIFSAIYFGREVNITETKTYQNILLCKEDIYVYSNKQDVNVKEQILASLKDVKITNSISLVKAKQSNMLLKAGESKINVLGKNKIALDGKVYKMKNINIYNIIDKLEII